MSNLDLTARQHPASTDALQAAATFSPDLSLETGMGSLWSRDHRWLQRLLHCNAQLRTLSQPNDPPAFTLEADFEAVRDDHDHYRLRRDAPLRHLLDGLSLLREVHNYSQQHRLCANPDEPEPHRVPASLQLSPHMEAALQAFPDEAMLSLDPLRHLANPRPVLIDALEALNGYLRQFRVLTQDAAFRKRLSNRQRAANKNRRSLQQLIAQLFAQYARLLVVRVDFSYLREYKTKATPARIEADRNAFLRQRRTHPLFKTLAAYVWKLEYGIEKGLHLHMLFFFDGSKVREDITLAEQLKQLWLEITHGEGLVYNSNLTAHKAYAGSPENALGMVSHADPVKLRALTRHVVTYLTKLDECIALCLPQGKRTFGHSQVTPPRPEQRKRGRPRKYPSVAIHTLPTTDEAAPAEQATPSSD